MTTETHFIDGKQTLEQQQDALNFVQNLRSRKVIDYAKSSQSNATVKANAAVSIDVPLADPQPGALALVAVTAANPAATIIAEQLAAGNGIVFHQKLFVGGAETEVLGFRKL
ncbi:MAG: hypothetical protein SFV18_19270 [Bryobacteraceae bacterium]|nr:hypothetical protein [Bryobacteraceae bacterium]